MNTLINRIIGLSKEVFREVLQMIFPQRCAGCGVSGGTLCQKCWQELSDLSCAGEIPVGGFRVFFAAQHSDILKKVLHRFKYISDGELAGGLAELLARRISILDIGNEFIVVPIPLHVKRERERGFNQSEVLAKLVVGKIGGRVMKFLVRERETEPQARLKRAERLKNVRGAFCLNTKFVHKLPETVWILDDVITTGSTFLECAGVLRSAGVKNVCGIMLAHGL